MPRCCTLTVQYSVHSKGVVAEAVAVAGDLGSGCCGALSPKHDGEKARRAWLATFPFQLA